MERDVVNLIKIHFILLCIYNAVFDFLLYIFSFQCKSDVWEVVFQQFLTKVYERGE